VHARAGAGLRKPRPDWTRRGYRLAARHYRSKLELLRDFLAAVQTETVKTRIMNRANMNPLSFSRYMALCRDRELLVEVKGGYTLTPQAGNLLQSINRVLSKATDLQAAVEVLSRSTRSGGYGLPRPETSLRPFDPINLRELLSQLPPVDRRPASLRQE
jgi:predicted transcriptional regulator